MFKNLIELTKVRIGFLVLTTTIIGFYLGSQGTINNLLLLYTVLGTLLSSTGSSVMNNVFESESDKLMDRTKNRVLPTKKISINTAKILGLSFITIGLLILYLKVNLLTCILSLATILLYLFLYTPLKRKSCQYFCCLYQALFHLRRLDCSYKFIGMGRYRCFFNIILLQHLHFYSIAYMYKEDYKSRFTDVTVIDNGIRRTVCYFYMH